MKRLKIKDTLYKIINGFNINESSREVKYSNVKVDFTDKGISDLPLKYQECQLVDADIEIKPKSDGTTVEGTSLSIDYDIDRNFTYSAKGQTSQSGTPTPSSPVPINITTGRQVVSVCGKNYFQYDTTDLYTTSQNGAYLLKIGIDTTYIDISQQDNGYYVNSYNNSGYRWYSVKVKLPKNTDLKFLCSTDTTINNIKIYGFNSLNTGTTGTLISNLTNGTTFNSGNYDYYLLGIYPWQQGKYVKDIQIVNANITDTSFEEYKGNTYEINLGKNIFDGVIEQGNYDGSTGAKTGSNAFYRNANKIPVQPSTTYTFSLNGISQRYVVLFYKSDNTFISQNSSLSTGTFTTPNNAYYVNFRCFQSDYTDDYATLKIMLEKGSVASSFSPYKTPIYLGKIGTYQDYIFKNTTENPLYDSNLEEGQWYIHKEIGRVVLNGSETWSDFRTYGNYYRIATNITDARITTTNDSDIYSNYFYGNVGVLNSSLADLGMVAKYRNTQTFYFETDQTSNANFKTWLSTHNVEVYYVLNTPTNTLIEDEELINQLNAIELLEGLNNVSVSSNDLPFIMQLKYNYGDEIEKATVKDIIYTGYVNNYTLPKMKNKLEYRELDIDLLSPLALATLRTADAIGTYNLQPLVKEIIQPLIDDGFVLKELNIGNNQITVNYLTETVESALNKLSNKFNFWWYIDKNKNIYINSINYVFNKNVVATYDDNNKINGLIDFTPSMESIDYCNTLDFTNVRVITSSIWQRIYDSYYEIGYNYIPDYYNPIMKKEYISKGDEIEFDIPFIINTDRFASSYTSQLDYNCYFQLWDMTTEVGTPEPQYTLLVDLSPNVALANNIEIADSYNEDKEFVFVRDSFFKNLIIGMKYNGNNTIQVGKVYSSTALMWAKVRINDNNEIEVNKDIISKTGIVEKQIDMNEQWLTFEELLEIANSLIRKNDINVEKVILVSDQENDYKIGDIISIDKSNFLTYGNFIITDKKRSNYDNVDTWTFTLNNTNILESYIDLFRATEQEEQTDITYNLITGDYSNDCINEKYEVEV